MRRLFLALMILVFACVQAQAKDAFNGSVLAETRLDADPTSVTSSGVNVAQFDKVSFWVTYDETEVGGGVSADVTLEVSYDDTTYVSASFYDYTGGATLQTSETLAADGTYLFWMNPDFNVNYARVKVVGTGTDADDLIDVTVNSIAQK